MQDKTLAQLRLFHLISPSLPVGAFTYSQGMEWAVESGWVDDETSLAAWLGSILHEGLTYLELPVLARLHNAAANAAGEAFAYWSNYVLASRESAELRDEECQRARALNALLQRLPDADNWPELRDWKTALGYTSLAGYALAAHHWHIAPRDLLAGLAWSWLEAAVTAGVKLIPLGQSAGQNILHTLGTQLPEAIQNARELEDDDIGAGLPAQAIASSLHETQYTRLFRS